MFVIGNWKMNPGTKREAEEIVREISEGVQKLKLNLNIRVDKQKIIICPPFLYLDLLRKFSNSNFFIGAQNLSSEKEGAFTGEISARQLVDFSVDYVIIGHSERRRYLNEGDEIINKKIKIALENNLKIIFCIGESLIEKEKGITTSILEKEITNGLKNIKLDKFQKDQIIIAYEPIWAIGTGIIPIYVEVLEIKNKIKEILEKINFNFPIIYGGSVDEDNIQGFIKISKMSGVLVGSKSLVPKSFLKMIKSLID